MNPPDTGKEVHLVSYPHGAPRPGDFAVVEVPVPEPRPGQALVHNRFLSVDPYMRGRMRVAESYVAPFALGEVMTGLAVGEVVSSAAPELAPGDVVLHDLGWREYALGEASAFRRVPAGEAPLSAWLGVLGMVGLTAWVGMLEIAALRPGDVVFVSGAAGAVGSLAGQIARLHGAARVVGSAGTAAKVAYLCDELGYDAAFDYHDGPVARRLAEVAPEGIDVYFDNVGGEHLEAAIGALRVQGRAALCGAISQYNAAETDRRSGQSRAHDRQAPDTARLFGGRPPQEPAGVSQAGRRLAGRRPHPSGRDDRRRRRERPRRLHRPHGRSEPRQDAGARRLTVCGPSPRDRPASPSR